MGTCSSSHPTVFQKTTEVPGLKIAVVGDPKVGKTSVIARYIHNQFSPVYIPTYKAAIENVVKKLNVPGHATVPITLWDIPGKEDLPLLESYFRDLDAVIVVVDVTDTTSVESGLLWRQAVLSTASFTSTSGDEENSNENEIDKSQEENKESNRGKISDVNALPFLLLGNKFDLLLDDNERAQTDQSEDGKIILVSPHEKSDTEVKTSIKSVSTCAQMLEEAAANGFVGGVMVSAKVNDLSVHAAIQNFLRHILEKQFVQRRWKPLEREVKMKRPRYEFQPQFTTIGIEEIDAEFAKAEEIVYRVNSLSRYQQDSLNKFAEECVEIGIIETSKDASMQNCLVALKDKLLTLDLRLKLSLQDDFCLLEVKAKTEDAELDKSIRYAIKTFNKEYVAVTKAMLTEYPLAESKLATIEQKVDKLCQLYQVPNYRDTENNTTTAVITNRDLLDKGSRVEKNRAMIRHTMHECHDCLAHTKRTVKQAKAAFVW